MIQEQIGDYVYYYSDRHYEKMMLCPWITDKLRQEMSHAVIDIKEQKIIKSRLRLDTIFFEALKDL